MIVVFKSLFIHVSHNFMHKKTLRRYFFLLMQTCDSYFTVNMFFNMCPATLPETLLKIQSLILNSNFLFIKCPNLTLLNSYFLSTLYHT